MISLISKTGQRKLAIFDYIKEQVGPVSISKLAEVYHVNKRTVYEDIRKLQALLPEDSIIYTKDKVILQLDSNYSSSKIIQGSKDLQNILAFIMIILR